ncbi:MAG: GNAT family N-acetyltransferase [Promethearchaeota archaeon]
MLTSLSLEHYDHIRSLCQGFDFQLIITALIELTSPGHIFVDDPEKPTCCFLSTAEGCFLAGNPNNDAFNAKLGNYLQEKMRTAKTRPEDEIELILSVHPKTWTKQFATIFPTQTPIYIPRRYYTCTQLKWKDSVTLPYTIIQISQSLLTSPDVSIPDHIRSWIASNWGSQDAFLKRGFGFATMHQQKLVSWSLTDCVSGNRAEIGIRTQPEHRQQGLATSTAAATVNYALQHGFQHIGWHTSQDNIGSIRVAEKVGFEKTLDYIWYLFRF